MSITGDGIAEHPKESPTLSCQSGKGVSRVKEEAGLKALQTTGTVKRKEKSLQSCRGSLRRYEKSWRKCDSNRGHSRGGTEISSKSCRAWGKVRAT
ncbi:UNVERIFIED_CONTAM: hypothetical protein K2H54_051805 [Gekko kuhli]